jgi:signal transduction histidine kinase
MHNQSEPITNQTKQAPLLRVIWRRLVPGDVGALVVAAYAIILMALISFALNAQQLPPSRYYGTILALSTMLALHVLWADIAARLGTARADQLLLTLNAGLFLLVNYLGLGTTAFTFLPFLLFMIAAQGLVTLGFRNGLFYTAVCTLAWLGVLRLRGADLNELLLNLASISLGLTFTLIMSWVVLLYQRQTARAEALAADLQAANLALQEARERERELAAAEERVRLAHDIHDGLGHHLTVLNVQLQAADKLIMRDAERAAAALALARAEAQAALAEVRRSVAAMRRAPLDGQALPEAIAALVYDFDRASPLKAEFALSGTPQTLGPAATMTLYRAAQEGLTNTQKHAAAASVRVELNYSGDTVQVRVSDDGQGGGVPSDDSSGFGLVGLRERVERLNGRFCAGSGPRGGFVLEVTLPCTLSH